MIVLTGARQRWKFQLELFQWNFRRKLQSNVSTLSFGLKVRVKFKQNWPDTNLSNSNVYFLTSEHKTFMTSFHTFMFSFGAFEEFLFFWCDHLQGLYGSDWVWLSLRFRKISYSFCLKHVEMWWRCSAKILQTFEISCKFQVKKSPWFLVPRNANEGLHLCQPFCTSPTAVLWPLNPSCDHSTRCGWNIARIPMSRSGGLSD